MKIVLSALAIVVLMIGTPLVYAQIGSTASMTSTEPGRLSELPHSHHPEAAYRSGFEHGVIDGNRPSNATSYIDQPKHGFAWHSSEFVKGYVNGYCSIPANKDVGTDDDQAAFYCPDGPSSAKWFIGKHEPITEGVIVATYGAPPRGMNVTYQYIDKTSGSSGSETRMVNQSGEMHFLGSTAELVGFYPGDKMTVNVSQCITVSYGYPECIPQRIIDNKTITLGETGGIVSLDLSKSAGFNAGVQDMTLPQPITYQPPPPYGTDVVPGDATSFTPTPPYGSESTQGPEQVTGPQTGAFDPMGAPGIGGTPLTPQAPVDYQDYTTPLPVPQTGGTPPAGTANVPITPFPTPTPGAIPSQQHLRGAHSFTGTSVHQCGACAPRSRHYNNPLPTGFTCSGSHRTSDRMSLYRQDMLFQGPSV